MGGGGARGARKNKETYKYTEDTLLLFCCCCVKALGLIETELYEDDIGLLLASSVFDACFFRVCI